MVVGLVQNVRTALKYRGGWKGLFQLMYTVRINFVFIVFILFFLRVTKGMNLTW
ncbi:MAG: hypothetical protein ACI8RD_000318 [Bacillariaceae sp.]|jgi:hypothetical protein